MKKANVSSNTVNKKALFTKSKKIVDEWIRLYKFVDLYEEVIFALKWINLARFLILIGALARFMLLFDQYPKSFWYECILLGCLLIYYIVVKYFINKGIESRLFQDIVFQFWFFLARIMHTQFQIFLS